MIMWILSFEIHIKPEAKGNIQILPHGFSCIGRAFHFLAKDGDKGAKMSD